MLEIHIDVGRFVTLFRDETLDKHLHTRRVDFGYSQAETHRRIRCRPASLAENILRTCIRDDVIHRQEILFITEFGNQLEFVLYESYHFLRSAPGPAMPHALLRQVPQISRRRLVFRDDFIRVFVTQFVE